MDPATIIAGITAVSGLMNAAKPEQVQGSNASDLFLQQMLSQQQSKKKDLDNMFNGTGVMGMTQPSQGQSGLIMEELLNEDALRRQVLSELMPRPVLSGMPRPERGTYLVPSPQTGELVPIFANKVAM
jgi:hypothetical protein